MGPQRSVLVAFVVMAIIAGPVRSETASAIDYPMHFQQFAVGALVALLAGAALLLLGMARGEAKLNAAQWMALVVLLVPVWLGAPLSVPLIRTIFWLHETGWGVTFLLSLAAPLWLGLLAALELVPVEVPRAVVGAGIAGMGAVLLIVPENAYSVTLRQGPVLALHLLLSVLMVYTWAFAASRLSEAGTFVVAGTYLVLSGAGAAVASIIVERPQWQAVSWHEVWAPLLVEAVVTATFWWLWFWLLVRMPLAAFCMNTLAAWVAALLPGFVMFEFLEWRGDAAIVLAVAALVVGLRAKVTEEQPLALGLGVK